MLQPDRIKYCFSLTHELPDVEFKGPGKGRDNPLFGKVVRAAIALANRRGGGIIILGVSEQSTGLSFDGLTPEQLTTWKYETIADGFNSHTSTPIGFERQEYEHNGKVFLVLEIHEFADIPIMCIKNYPERPDPRVPESACSFILRAGIFYVRTPNKPESKEVLSSEMVRLLFQSAIDKGIQNFVTQTKLAGLTIAPSPEDKELFARQVQGWESPLLEEIRSRGYWDIHIHPATFQPERLPLSQLRELIIRASLNYRGWEFPYITARMPETGNDWIGLEAQQLWALQAWRFFQSGHFAAEIGFLDDWEDLLSRPTREDWVPNQLLSVLDVVFRLTEIFGLASRLAITDAYRDESSMMIAATLHNVQGRQLHERGALNRRFPVFGYTTSAKQIPYTTTLAKEDVIARPQELALKAAQHIFERFGWSPSQQLLATMQSELQIHA